jgi:hypothetical protein
MATYEEFEDIALGLEKWHGLFYSFWSMGVPRFTRAIPTAAVAFNKKGQYVEFIFNPDFWDQLTPDEREFIICHECLHVINGHGVRMTDAEQKVVANIAMDIVVNHSLIKNFHFKREALTSEVEFPGKAGGKKAPLKDILVWKDNTFEKPTQIKDEETYEYYYQKLMEQVQQMIKDGKISKDGTGIPIKMPGGGKGEAGPIDSHEFLGEGDQKSKGKDNPSPIDGQKDEGTGGLETIPDELVDDIVDGIRRALNADENSQMTQAGIGRGDQVHKVREKRMKALQKWESLVKIWTAEGERPDDVWTKKARRHNMLPPNFILPMDEEIEKPNAKVDVWFFQDISGSCTDFLDDFYNASRTFPDNFFKIRMFGFDTSVIEVDPKNPNLREGGGTSFTCIEQAIQDKIKETKCRYPDAVFVFSDGCGNQVNPQYPERWYWFLEGHYQQTNCIPKESTIKQLKDFVDIHAK